jgi:3-oxoacyl-[acyl-carrier-protein] synthase-3
MINIEKYGNTTSATIPLCLHEWEHKLKKSDKLILAQPLGEDSRGERFI